MKNFLLAYVPLFAGLLLVINLLSPVQALADTICNPVYGGQQCQTFQLSIDKQILNPSTGNYVANLNLNDHNFNAGDTVTFKVTVQNTGTTLLDPVTVVDTMPLFTDFAGGPGSFDTGTNKMTFTENNMSPGETRSFNISVKVRDNSALTFTGTIDCSDAFNTVQASAPNSQTVNAVSRFCIQKPGGQVIGTAAPPVTRVPSTGSSEWILAGLTLALLTGIVIIKKQQLL